MFIELEPIFNNIGASVPFDYEMDMSDEEFWAGKPFQKAVRVKGEAVNRAGIVCIEAQATVEVFTDCDRCASSIDRVFDITVSHTLVTSLNDEENDELILVEACAMTRALSPAPWPPPVGGCNSPVRRRVLSLVGQLDRFPDGR